MVPSGTNRARPASAAPRTRGDGPSAHDGHIAADSCSPHPWGWSRGVDGADGDGLLLPAPVGMVPCTHATHRDSLAAPRTRGDGPPSVVSSRSLTGCSPHPWGWSPGGRRGVSGVRLLPAPVGMVPGTTAYDRLQAAAPRTRGDGPVTPFELLGRIGCSPHPWGWSRAGRVQHEVDRLLPAPVGMVPGRRPARARGRPAPRTRGDGPDEEKSGLISRACSPHPWGWSHLRLPGGDGLALLPAPVGMVPSKRARGWSRRTAPRTRGDGPAPSLHAAAVRCCSPHPWGWSRTLSVLRLRAELLPAPVGMVPD